MASNNSQIYALVDSDRFRYLSGFLAYALIFAPVIGSLLGRRKRANDINNDSDDTALKNSYRKAINFAVKNPVESVAYTFLTMFLILGNIVPNYGKQFVYFPSVEPWLIEADIQAEETCHHMKQEILQLMQNKN